MDKASASTTDSSMKQNQVHNKPEDSKNTWKKIFDDDNNHDDDDDDNVVKEDSQEKLKYKPVTSQESVLSSRDTDKKVYVPLAARSYAALRSTEPLLFGSSRAKTSATTVAARPFDEFAVGTSGDDGSFTKTDGTNS